MNHAVAVDVIYDLIPKMASESPEAVLHSYAEDNDLAPEQLAKLARVFNSCSTLHQLGKDRNSRPFLVDPPAIVRDYIEKTSCSKLDLEDSFLFGTKGKEASAPPPAASSGPLEVPAIWKAARPVEPAPEEVPVVSDSEQYRRWKMALAHEAKTAIKLAEESSQLVDSYRAGMAKLARDISNRSYREEVQFMPELEKDAHGYFNGAEIDSAFGMLEKISGELGLTCVRMDKGASEDLSKVILHRDRTGFIPALKEAWGQFKQAAEKMAAFDDSLDKLFELKESKWLDAAGKETLRKVAAEVRAVSYITEKTANARPRPDPREGGSAGRDFDALARAFGGKPSTGGSKIKGETPPAGDWSSLEHVVQLPIHIRRDLASGLGEAYDFGKDLLGTFSHDGELADTLSRVAERNHGIVNRNNVNLGRVAEDTRAMASLQRLMLTDEIIGGKDPDQVVEAFNTIRVASPEVASDPSLLRILLRNSLETQGVGIDEAGAVRKFTEDKRKNDITDRRPARA